MRLFKTLAAGALVLGLAAPAFAIGEGPNHQFMFMTDSGKVMTMPVDGAAQQALLLKGAKRLDPGTILYTSDGAIYLIQDHAMPDGKMLSDAIMNGN